MDIRKLCIVVALAGLVPLAIHAQRTESTPAAGSERPAADARAHATMNQLMQSILFPNANIVFATQRDDPAGKPRDPDPSTSTDPFAGVYGGWQAVENAGLALAESANLLLVPGRLCENERPVPVDEAAWIGFVQQFRDASMASYEAAKTKDQDRVIEATEQLVVSCSDCHQAYRRDRSRSGQPPMRCES